MKNARSFYVLTSLVVLSMLFSACAPATETPGAIDPTPGLTESPATEPAATEPAATEPAATEPAAEGGAMADSIRVAVVRGAMIDTMTKIADAYEQANPGVTINVEEEPEGGAFDALIAAGNQ